jgi:GNAT superfamily N-acetyltransferase
MTSQQTRPETTETGDHEADEFRFVAADGPEVQPLLEELELEYDTRYSDLIPEPAAVELARYAPELFAAPDGAFLVLLRGGVAVAGGAFKRYDEHTAEVKRVWTSAALRGQGLAGRVLAALESEARRLGYRAIYLTTGPRQPEAVRLYTRAGYTPQFDPTRPAEEIGIHAFTKALDADPEGD